jgi:hypothetical protein
MEKLVDKHIMDGALKEYPLHRNQHAYQIGKSTETILHNVVTCIENATEHKDIALSALLDTEGASDKTSFDTIKQAAERHGTVTAVCRWICAILESRNISAKLSGEIMGEATDRGCQQAGGVLSPLLWSLAVDNLLWGLNNNDSCTIAILINEKFPQTVSEVL